MNGERQILYYKSYFIDFFLSIDEGAQKKVAYVLDMLKTQERLSTNFVKFIRDGLFELSRRGKHRHAVQWISEKDAENPEQRDRQGVETKRRVL